jgi:hypothetical protein
LGHIESNERRVLDRGKFLFVGEAETAANVSLLPQMPDRRRHRFNPSRRQRSEIGLGNTQAPIRAFDEERRHPADLKRLLGSILGSFADAGLEKGPQSLHVLLRRPRGIKGQTKFGMFPT